MPAPAKNNFSKSLFRTIENDSTEHALMAIYHRLYLKALKEEQKRGELAGGDQAEKPNGEFPAGEESERMEP